jgi:hypothetical protein
MINSKFTIELLIGAISRICLTENLYRCGYGSEIIKISIKLFLFEMAK